jgi:uncharacterized membrane protein YcaP (DUF421 family)
VNLFGGWSGIVRLLVTGTCAYVALVVMVRIAGKRTLSKMNAFDLVVTVALGSTLSSVLTSKTVPLLDGVIALGLLIGLQVAAAFTASRWPRANAFLKAEPTLLVRDGKLLPQAMKTERVTEDEVLAALHENGLERVSQAEAVILESSGEFSVIPARRSARE